MHIFYISDNSDIWNFESNFNTSFDNRHINFFYICLCVWQGCILHVSSFMTGILCFDMIYYYVETQTEHIKYVQF